MDRVKNRVLIPKKATFKSSLESVRTIIDQSPQTIAAVLEVADQSVRIGLRESCSSSAALAMTTGSFANLGVALSLAFWKADDETRAEVLQALGKLPDICKVCQQIVDEADKRRDPTKN